MDFETFPLQLLSPLASLALLSPHPGTLALMGRIVELGICPKASSSPHHLFLAAFLAVQRPTMDARTDNGRWIALAERLVPLEEMLVVLREVEAAAEERGDFSKGLHTVTITMPKRPRKSLMSSTEVIDLDGKCKTLREIVTAKCTTGTITIFVSTSHFYRLTIVRVKLVCNRSDVFSPPPSHNI